MLDQADGGDAVGEHQLVAERVMQGVGNFGAEYHLERVRGEGASLRQLQALPVAILVVLEITFVGAHHPIAAVRVAQGNWNRPFDLRVAGVMLVAVPADVIGGIADAKHRIQQQVDRA
ncbi:hypothetical protein D3C86_1797620 [compost metagenome]